MNDKDTFLSLYNELDSLCRVRYDLNDRNESAIASLINELRRSDYYRNNDLGDDLDALRNLRNSLAHIPDIEGNALLSVNPFAVHKINEILQFVKDPPMAKDRAIPLSRLFILSPMSHLLETIKSMDEKGYSHAPVLDEHGYTIGVFSLGSVFSYLADHGETDLNDGDTVQDVLEYIALDKHRNERYAFFPKNASFEDIVKEFEESKRKYGKRLGMVFLTEHGKSSEKILYALSLASTV